MDIPGKTMYITRSSIELATALGVFRGTLLGWGPLADPHQLPIGY